MSLNNNVERWLSIKEIAEYLGVSRDTILNWISKKDFPAAKIDKCWRFKISEVDNWIHSNPAKDK